MDKTKEIASVKDRLWQVYMQELSKADFSKILAGDNPHATDRLGRMLLTMVAVSAQAVVMFDTYHAEMVDIVYKSYNGQSDTERG